MPQLAKVEAYSSSDHLEGMPRHSIQDSFLFDIQMSETAGKGGSEICAALRTRDNTQISVALADIGARYGIKSYLRIARDHMEEVMVMASKCVSIAAGKYDPFRMAQTIVKKMNNSYLLGRISREFKRAGKREFYLSYTTPLPTKFRVSRPGGPAPEETHDEVFLMGMRMRIALGSSVFEFVQELASIAISQHTMTRLWERSEKRHEDIHIALVEAYRIMEASWALTTLAANTNGRPGPHYIAAPFLGGMIIMSRKEMWMPSHVNRYGWQRKSSRQSFLSDWEDQYFTHESYQTLHLPHPQRMTNRKIYAGTTFMGRSDIGNQDRVDAIDEFERLLSTLDLDEACRLMRTGELIGVLPGAQQLKERFQLQKVLELQSRILPRSDPSDDRLYALTAQGDVL
ncbi:hypothetical protein [Croceicoccus gelatinilyticus]|uniref:hypothetical protein n=1 Tax=Croceicoccus gelatinilyticus TaxID=2835536 RepID=UPI001BD198AE|nr:hypothetical protein [Croceicoccus gelatinilyticus]MBS7671451.1 hypothetical protein [Croceicoccus gelatinilyticus]